MHESIGKTHGMIGSLYHNYRGNQIIDNGLKSSIFFKVQRCVDYRKKFSNVAFEGSALRVLIILAPIDGSLVQDGISPQRKHNHGCNTLDLGISKSAHISGSSIIFDFMRALIMSK